MFMVWAVASKCIMAIIVTTLAATAFASLAQKIRSGRPIIEDPGLEAGGGGDLSQRMRLRL